jgi:hypothetical protein
MQNNLLVSRGISRQATADKVRRDSRRFVDSLAQRLAELERLAASARQFNVFDAEEYADFKRLFLNFSDLAEEFQMLSHLTEQSLAKYQRIGARHWNEHKELDEYFRKLQVPMLHQVITTNLRLLRVWDDRLQHGEGLPYGARELFVETIRVIHNARIQLLRPRYFALLDEAALRDADRADRLLRTLIQQSPKLFNFGEENALEELLGGDNTAHFGEHATEPPH